MTHARFRGSHGTDSAQAQHHGGLSRRAEFARGMQLLPIFRLAMFGLWLLAFTAYAGDAKPNYHEAFRQLHDRGQFNGAVLIVKDSKVLLDDHFGPSDASDGTPLSADS